MKWKRAPVFKESWEQSRPEVWNDDQFHKYGQFKEHNVPFPDSPGAKFVRLGFDKLVGPLKLRENVGKKCESHAPDGEILVFIEEIIA